MSAGHIQREAVDNHRTVDEHLNNTEERTSLFSETESAQRCSGDRSRSQSPTTQSAPKREAAAEWLEKSRKRIGEAAEKKREHREAQTQDIGPRYVQTEGRFQPDGWGYVERGPRGQRPVGEILSLTGGQSLSTRNENSSADISTGAASHLRKHKRLGPHAVPLGKQTPLREVVTKHLSANEIRRSQSKISAVDKTKKDAEEEQKEWDYSDMEDDEIF